jgi:tetrapyrrole methylase family protein/MazG family protein
LILIPLSPYRQKPKINTTMTTDPTDIYIVGTGMVGNRQLTRETEEAFKKSARIYHVVHHNLLKEYLEDTYSAETIDLTDSYSADGTRTDAYENMAEEVLGGAEKEDDPVAFALYGHPMVFVSPSRWVVEQAPERNLEVKTLPGVSSMDCLYADIAFDPAEGGLQMFEATGLLIQEWEINPDIPAMIWQIGALESIYYPMNWSAPERFTRFREYLERFYPADHTVKILETATHPIARSKQIEFELGEFESMHDQITPSQTLLVPPVRQRPPQNEELLEDIESSDHVETITTNDEFGQSYVEATEND